MPDARRGLLFGVAAYAMWGLFPLYWPLLEPAGAFEILAHRVLWSCVTMIVLLLAAAARTPQLRAIWRDRRVPAAADGRGRRDQRQLGDLHLGRQQRPGRRDLARLLHQPAGDRADGRVHPAASGCGRCSGWRWASPTAAVVVLTLDYGRLPYVALVLAFSFGSYGLCKKTANVGATESLTYETAVIAPFALAYVGWLGVDRRLELRQPRRRPRRCSS